MLLDTAQKLLELKKEKRAFRTKFTKFVNFMKNEQNKAKLTEIHLRIQKIEGILEKFEDVQSQIDVLSNTNSTDYDIFEFTYYSELSFAHDLLNKENTRVLNNEIQSNVGHQNSSRQSHIRLPTIELATFDGAHDKWLDYFNSFISYNFETRLLTKNGKNR